MKRTFLVATFLGMTLMGPLRAGQIQDTLAVELAPVSGAISGAAGATVGWGFTATWTPLYDPTYWATITNVSLVSQTNPAGVYDTFTDYVSPQGGPVDYSFAPSGPGATWTQGFDGVSQGVGAYTIRANAVGGALDTGMIQFTYDVYAGDPVLGGVWVGGGYTVQVPYSVLVEGSTLAGDAPEPAAWMLSALGCALLGAVRRRAASR